MMSAPAWLTAFPIAHRGLHNHALGIVENSLSAARAAVARGYAIECDVQLSSDGVVMVFHDETLDRLTDQTGLFRSKTSSALSQIELLKSGDQIPTFDAFLQEINGQVPIICEIKSNFDGNPSLTDKTIQRVQKYHGPLAIKSFDPEIVATVSRLAPERPCGFIGESSYDDAEWNFLTSDQKRTMASLAHFEQARPDFLSWYIKDVEQGPPQLARKTLGMPLMTWTVRSKEDHGKGNRFADQIVFEGFFPEIT